ALLDLDGAALRGNGQAGFIETHALPPRGHVLEELYSSAGISRRTAWFHPRCFVRILYFSEIRQIMGVAAAATGGARADHERETCAGKGQKLTAPLRGAQLATSTNEGGAKLPLCPDFSDGERSDDIAPAGQNIADARFAESGRRSSAALPMD